MLELWKSKQVQARMERHDADDDGGRWITTENGNHVHINGGGEPDKGNPYVIAAMQQGKYSEKAHDAVLEDPHFVGEKEVEEQAYDQLKYNLAYYETHLSVTSFRIVQYPTDGGLADVDVEYDVDVKIPVGRDIETGRTEYEYETEGRKETLQLKVLK